MANPQVENNDKKPPIWMQELISVVVPEMMKSREQMTVWIEIPMVNDNYSDLKTMMGNLSFDHQYAKKKKPFGVVDHSATPDESNKLVEVTEIEKQSTASQVITH